jgi:hypothetical protein
LIPVLATTPFVAETKMIRVLEVLRWKGTLGRRHGILQRVNWTEGFRGYSTLYCLHLLFLLLIRLERLKAQSKECSMMLQEATEIRGWG